MRPLLAPAAPCLLSALAFGACSAAAPQDPPRAAAAARPPAAADPVAALLSRMSVPEKAGQLLAGWIMARTRGEARARLRRQVRELGLGGVVLSLGTVGEAAELGRELQQDAAVPLLLAGDFEGGVAFRFAGATDMGNQMLVGASGLSRLARAMGEVTGREARALGVPWVLAPVLDVNSNPRNPIINVRSFGEDPRLVARLGAEFAAGVRSAGAVPCGKHFPGHGDVATDSHLELPAVPGDGDRLRAVELLPFRVAAAAGLESVMSGHLAVPGLGEDPRVPATLSPRILGGVLRGELGFRGLVVTDALEMGAVTRACPPDEAAVRALLAGADVLLMPPDPAAARRAIVAAVQSGRVSRERLDEAVRRVLELKARAGLFAPGPHGPAPDWRRSVGAGAAAAVADEIGRRGLTLVRDPAGLLPLEKEVRWRLVTIADQDDGAPGAAFAPALAAAGLQAVDEVRLAPGSPPEAVTAAAIAVAGSERVLLALHVRVRAYAGRIGPPPNVLPVLAALRPEQQVVAVSFGSPYLALDLPRSCSFLCAYASTACTERAAAGALCGAAAVTGRLPVSLPGVAERGAGLSLLPGTGVGRCAPADEGVDPALGAHIEALLLGAVADGAFPGAVCVVARRGRVVAEVAAGRFTYAPDAPAVTVGTPYDLASLTKVCATVPAVLRLCAMGRLSLDDPVQKWVPAFQGTGKERVTVRHLLAHTSGLPAYERYYRTMHGKAAIVAAAAAEGLMTEPGERVVYSDLGLILLMAVVEACSGEDFAAFVQREVFLPLGMRGAAFAPPGGPPALAPPTEVDPARGGLVQGRVHDENAFAMGGVSGHAGLFATADDVLRIGLLMLGRGRGVLPAPLVQAALEPATAVGSTRGLGFDLLGPGGWGGSEVSPGTFGHTGFTGTSLWCDPRLCLCVVLLTNRVHPTRVNGRIGGVRRRLHDLVRASVEH